MASQDPNLGRKAKIRSASGGGGYTISQTRPDELLRHDISDDELGALGDMKRAYYWDGMWAALGVFLGSLPNSVNALYHAYFATPRAPMSGLDFLLTLVWVVSFAVGILLFVIFQGERKSTGDLVTEIRERARHVAR